MDSPFPFQCFADQNGDENGNRRRDDGGQDDGIGVGRARILTHLNGYDGDKGSKSHVDDGEGTHIVAGGLPVGILLIKLFHSPQGKHGGAVSGAEDIGHKAHDDIGKGFGVPLPRKKQGRKRQEQAGKLVDQSGPFGDFHQPAPHCHDTGEAENKGHRVLGTFHEGSPKSRYIAGKTRVNKRGEENNRPNIVHHKRSSEYLQKIYEKISKNMLQLFPFMEYNKGGTKESLF